MSTGEQRPLAQALADAQAFKGMFPSSTYERWEFAGSIRRHKAIVGDVDHVIIPRFGPAPAAAGMLFAGTGPDVNLVWNKLEELVAGDPVRFRKHLYGTSGPRWGPKARGVDVGGMLHELRCVAAASWGPAFAIRTGPADFSRRMVTQLHHHRRRQHDGDVWACKQCTACFPPEGGGKLFRGCGTCDGSGLERVEMIPCPDERTFFDLCGEPWTEPPERRL